MLRIADDASTLARCFRDAPPRCTEAAGNPRVLRARQDRSGTQLVAGRALGLLSGKSEDHMVETAMGVSVTKRVEPVLMASYALGGDVYVMLFKVAAQKASPGLRVERIAKSRLPG